MSGWRPRELWRKCTVLYSGHLRATGRGLFEVYRRPIVLWPCGSPSPPTRLSVRYLAFQPGQNSSTSLREIESMCPRGADVNVGKMTQLPALYTVPILIVLMVPATPVSLLRRRPRINRRARFHTESR